MGPWPTISRTMTYLHTPSIDKRRMHTRLGLPKVSTKYSTNLLYEFVSKKMNKQPNNHLQPCFSFVKELLLQRREKWGKIGSALLLKTFSQVCISKSNFFNCIEFIFPQNIKINPIVLKYSTQIIKKNCANCLRG